MNKSAILVLIATLPVAIPAAVPLRWTVETNRIQPAQFEAYHGEALEFEATFNSLGKPLALDSHTATLYYQTNGMDQAWWSVPGAVSGNVARAVFTPAMDPAAKQITVFLGVSAGPSNQNYRANASVRFRNSPGAAPGWIEPPVVKLDFSTIETLNAPWFTKDESNDRFPVKSTVYTKSETDSALAGKQDVISDLATIRSGAALGATAVQPSAIGDMETKTHAAATYQPIGNYLTTESDPSVADWAKKPNPAPVTDLSPAISYTTAVSNKLESTKQPTISDLAIIRSGAALGATALQSYTETDPTVSSWAKATTKPSYTWTEIGSKPTWIGSSKPSYTWTEIGSKPTWIGSSKPSYNWSEIGSKPTIPTDSTVSGWGYLKAESDPTVDGKIATHNSDASSHADIRGSVAAKYSKPSSGIPKTDLSSTVQTSLGKADSALQAAHNTSTTAHTDIRTAVANAQAHSEATRQIVSTWEGFLDGSNVVFWITNYISGAYSLDHAKLQIKELLPDSNEYRIVYDSRTEITNHTAAAKREIVGYVDGVATVLRGEIAEKGDQAWGRRSSTGQDVPISNTVWVTEQNLRIAGGMEYERVAVGEGAIYVLTSKGQTPYMIGDEGALMLKDDGGTNYFGMVRSDSYTIGCNTDGIRTQNNLVYLDYAVTMSDHPCIWYTESLEGDVVWEQLNLPDGSAVPGASHTVIWDESPRLGAQECYINCPEGSGFFRATIEVAGDARFRTNMPAEIPSFYCADDPTKKVKIIWNNGNPKFTEAQ